MQFLVCHNVQIAAFFSVAGEIYFQFCHSANISSRFLGFLSFASQKYRKLGLEPKMGLMCFEQKGGLCF